jgi:hypothetical protein
MTGARHALDRRRTPRTCCPWPTNSAKQIARRLHRPRSAICGKAKRLRAEGVLPDGVHKHFDVVALKARPRPVRSTVKKPAPVLNDTVPHLKMQLCPLLELNNTRCRWPLGEVPGPVLFCGGPTGRGCPYCPHHLQMASKS